MNLDTILFDESAIKTYKYNSESRGAITRYINQVIKSFQNKNSDKLSLVSSLDQCDPSSKSKIKELLNKYNSNNKRNMKLVTSKGKLVLLDLKKKDNDTILSSAKLLVNNNATKKTMIKNIPFKKYLL